MDLGWLEKFIIIHLKNMTNKNKKIAVLYHNKCDDGFGAAWVAWKKFKDKADYVGVTYGDPPPKGLTGKDIYLLDFCYPKNVLEELMKITKSLTVIDHHISMKEVVESVPRHLFEPTKHSGAVLTWMYFFSKKPIPKILRYVEGVDLWQWKLPRIHELSASLSIYPREFKIWSRIARDWEKKLTQKKYIAEGGAIRKEQINQVKKAVEDSFLVDFCGYKTLVSNSFAFVSEIGAALVKKHPPIGIIWAQRSDKIVVSLRSNGKVDVSKLAAKFGGGGHKASAAFRLEAEQKLPWKIVKK